MVRSVSLMVIICVLCGVGFTLASQDKKQLEIDEKEYLHNVSIKRTPESWEALAHFYDRTKQYRKVLKVTEKIRKDFPGYLVNIAAVDSYSQLPENQLKISQTSASREKTLTNKNETT